MNRSFFWDKIADRYSKQPVADETAYQNKLEVTRGYFRADMEVLEFGCGTGSTAIAHAPFVKRVRAIDISPNMVEIARRKAEQNGIRNVTFECASIDDYSAIEQSFDAVMGHSVLHLLENKEAALDKVLKLLKPHGVFVSSTVCIGDTMRYFRFIAPIGQLVGLVLKVFTRVELEDSITMAGFEIVHTSQPAGKMKSVFIVARRPG